MIKQSLQIMLLTLTNSASFNNLFNIDSKQQEPGIAPTK